MSLKKELSTLRWQRNGYIIFAITAVVASLAFALPRVADRRTQLSAANQVVLRLQDDLRWTQDRVRSIQGQILQVQAEIKLVQEKK